MNATYTSDCPNINSSAEEINITVIASGGSDVIGMNVNSFPTFEANKELSVVQTSSNGIQVLKKQSSTATPLNKENSVSEEKLQASTQNQSPAELSKDNDSARD